MRFAALITGICIGIAGTALAGSVLGSTLFRDVPAGAPYDMAVGNMVNAKILEGFDDGTFHPDEYITRGQLALALDRLLLSLDKNTPQQAQKATRQAARKRVPRKTSANVASVITATGTFHLATTGFSIIEKARSITVSVQRVNGNAGTASIEYAVEDETTTRGADYVDTKGTLTFGDGEKTKTITIPLKDDAISEGVERLRIELTNPAGAGLGSPSTMVVSLLDDETPNGNAQLSSSSAMSSNAPASSGGVTLSFSTELYSMGEGGAAALITVTRSGVTSGQSAVEYETSNGSAVAGSEYTAVKGTLTFSSGELQKTFTVPVTNNTTIDGMKTVTVSLKNPTGASLGATATAQLAIMDDEIEPYGIGSLKFQKKAERVNETTGEVFLTILRVGGSKGTVTVDYATKSGLALAGSDYTETNGTLTFIEGEAGKSLRIPITRDANALEEDESFSVSISNATGGASIIDPNVVTVTITP